MAEQEAFEIIIIGGGPAGLNAALVLGRACRKVLVCDNQQYRNSKSHGLHGFLSRDGISPKKLQKIAQKELSKYKNITLLFCEVTNVAAIGSGFKISLLDGKEFTSRKLILATGLKDELPNIPGAEKLYGKFIFHCPYCDGWEHRNQSLCVYGGEDDKAVLLALELTQWSSELTLCTDGQSIHDDFRDDSKRFSIKIEERNIKRLSSQAGELCIIFKEGPNLTFGAMFVNTKKHQRSSFAEKLRCDIENSNNNGKTNINGVYVVGDASADVLQSIVAAGQGASAAICINSELLKEDGVLK